MPGSAGLPSNSARLHDIVFDPQHSDILYAGGWHAPEGRLTGVIFKSTDAGRTWTQVLELEGGMFRALAVDSHNPHILYAGSSGKIQEPGFFRSVDGGRSWKKVHSGQAVALAIDPHGSNAVYVGMRHEA